MRKVADVKRQLQLPYKPEYDFYKIIREALEDTHRHNRGKPHLQRVLGTLKDPKKQVNYPAIVAGYTRWWGKNSFTWFDPPASLFSNAGVDVSINPELGLEIGGKPYVIKLYFKGEKLTKNRIELVTQLMEECLRPNLSPDVVIAVLDTRAAKFFTGSELNPLVVATLKAELAYIGALWAQL
jgi:hypothetical protein